MQLTQKNDSLSNISGSQLYLITMREYGAQFLVNQNSEEAALQSAIRENKQLGKIDGIDLSDTSLYDTEIVDFSMLAELIRRDDFLYISNDTIVFDS